MADKYETRGRWVVGTDGSLRSEKAIMWAARHLSERNEPVPLLIIHAIPAVPVPTRSEAFEALQQGTEYQEMVDTKAHRIVAEVAERVRQQFPGLVVETAVAAGHPADLLALAGRDADQVIVGARGVGAPALVKMLGGVTDHVVRTAQGSVAVVPDQAEDRPGAPVVVGLDDSPQGRLAIARAFQAASLRGVPLIAITAWDYGPYTATDAEVWAYSINEMSEMMTSAAVWTTSAQAVTRQAPRRSCRRPTTGAPSAVPRPTAATTAPARARLRPAAETTRSRPSWFMAAGRRPA